MSDIHRESRELQAHRPPDGISESDYEAIEDAVMETARGRWFLKEYARRMRAAETQTLRVALERIENMISAAHAPSPDAARVVQAGERLQVISERLLDISWYMRERGLPSAVCNSIDTEARNVAGVVVELASDLASQTADEPAESSVEVHVEEHVELSDAVSVEDVSTSAVDVKVSVSPAENVEPQVSVESASVEIAPVEIAPVEIEPVEIEPVMSAPAPVVRSAPVMATGRATGFAFSRIEAMAPRDRLAAFA